MTKDEIIALLSQKIDSREKWYATLNDLKRDPGGGDGVERLRARIVQAVDDFRRIVHCTRATARDYALLPAGALVESRSLAEWWGERESARTAAGIYPETSPVMNAVLAATRSSRTGCPIGMQFAHPSVEDPRRVARTVSAEDGLRDRQLTTTVDKWLRMMFPFAADHEIQFMAQRHISEVDPTLQIARTEDEVERIYRNGPTACMSHPPENYGLEDGLHPSHVYAHNGFGVAFMGSVDNASARAVVWVNPDDENDKRYVRVYPGGSALERKLMANGYKHSTFDGAKLKAIRDHDNNVIVPYMDGVPGGTIAGLYGAVLEGDPDNVLLLTAEQIRRVGSAYAVYLQTTSVRRSFRPTPRSLVYRRCVLTGADIGDNQLTVQVMLVDGTMGVTTVAGITQASPGYVEVRHTQPRVVFVREDLEGTLWVRVDDQRITTALRDQDIGLGRLTTLDAGLYPGVGLTRRPTVTTLDGKTILASDAVSAVVRREDGEGIVALRLHKDSPQVQQAQASTRKNITSEYVTITPVNGKPVLVKADAMDAIHTTVSGRRVTTATHDVGLWGSNRAEYARNLERVGGPYQSYTTTVLRTHRDEPWTVSRDVLREYLGALTYSSHLPRVEFLRRMQRNTHAWPMEGWFSYWTDDGASFGRGLASCVTSDVKEAIARHIGAPLPDSENDKQAWAAANLLAWQREWVEEELAKELAHIEAENQRVALEAEAARAPSAEFEDMPF